MLLTELSKNVKAVIIHYLFFKESISFCIDMTKLSNNILTASILSQNCFDKKI